MMRRMQLNNAEKFAEVFGIDMPIKVSCIHKLNDQCRTCRDISTCLNWATAEYKEKESDHMHISKTDGTRLELDIFDYIKAMPEIPNKKKNWEIQYQSTCPCGGTLTAMRSTYNCHIRALVINVALR